jgi:hypothetical protein
MFVGALGGPFVLKMISEQDVTNLYCVTQIALSYIAFSAGTHLYLPELRSLFKTILVCVAMVASATFIIISFVVFGMGKGGIAPFLNGLNDSCAYTGIFVWILACRSGGGEERGLVILRCVLS